MKIILHLTIGKIKIKWNVKIQMDKDLVSLVLRLFLQLVFQTCVLPKNVHMCVYNDLLNEQVFKVLL